MSTLKYKDYQGSVSFEDGALVVQILHIDDFVTTECDSAASAQKAFEALVDDYLETCKALNKEPSKPFKGSFNVRVSPNLHRAIAMAAMDANETMNAWIAKILEENIERRKAVKRLLDPLFISKVTEQIQSPYSSATARISMVGEGSTVSASFARVFYELPEIPAPSRWGTPKNPSRKTH